MKRFAVINADDFGISEDVNRAIARAFDRGILTSTSLMVTGDACAEAVELAKIRPKLAVGLHLVLCCGKSALPASEIPDLVDRDGNFPEDPTVAGLRYQFSRAARSQLKREIKAQLEKFQQTGLKLSHLDGHLHLHCHPVILAIISELAENFAIEFVRLPQEELNLNLSFDRADLSTKLIRSFIFDRLRQVGENIFTKKQIGFADRVYGLLQTGQISEDYLLHLIGNIKKVNLIEIYAHPDLKGTGKQELAALTSKRVRECLSFHNFELTNYNELRMANLK
ncbi:MAG: hopanoid biosynthesis-associated protein HpnK [Prochloraceae cyanobacterium]